MRSWLQSARCHQILWVLHTAPLNIYAKFQRAIFTLKRRHGITWSLPRLMAIRCQLGVTRCLVMKPMCFQGEEILSKPSKVSPGLDWQALSQKMRSGGSHTAKRIYYLGWQGVLSQRVSAVSHLALSLCLWSSPSSAQRGNSFQV